MKKIICEKYKMVNVILFLGLLLLLAYMHFQYDDWFKGPDALDFYKYHHAIYAPILTGSKWLAGILAVLLFFPSRIFRKWLFYVAPPIILLTYFLVQGISVYSSNLLNPTRAKMAENGMMLLAFVTVVFVASYFVYEWRKKKLSKTA